MGFSRVLISLAVVGLVVSTGFSAPMMLTGNPAEADYDIVVRDEANEPDLALHLDIDRLLLSDDPGNGPADRYYLGLTVNDPDISRTGGPTSFLGRTVLDCLFLGDGGSVLHELSVVITVDNVYAYVDGMLLDATDYEVAIDSGLEIAFPKDTLPNMVGADTFTLLAQLDDTGMATDDQVLAFGIPEPATLSLLVMGGLMLVRRRRAV